ncbi:MAG: transcriptional regulator, partial [Nocardioidaceae bacterium]|nr:transcriptional regulator [Nocardioidaceae bacterium]
MISSGRLSDVFVEVADTLVADFDVIDFLHNLTEHAAAVSGAGAVGILIADQQGELQFMAASNPTGELLERAQLESAEGPCVDSFRTRQAVVNADLANAQERWPVFAPRAVAAGFQSVHAFPMRLRDQAIGALNLFGSADTVFEPDDVGVVQA